MRLLVVATCLFAALATSATTTAAPNVLLILADDLNCSLGCYGNTVCQTPNIDKLAARGVRFDRAYCQYPVCNPSRTSFLSGLRPATTRVVDNVTRPQDALPDVAWLPEWFRRHGYTTLKVGKVFHTSPGFEDPKVWDVETPESPQAKSPPPATIAREQGDRGLMLNVNDDATWDGQVAARAIELLEQGAHAQQPFFLTVGFRRPHAPYMAPRRYFDLYPPERMILPAEPADHLAGIPPIALTYKPGRPLPSAQEQRETIASYYATVSFLDALVGQVTESLDRLDLWRNTLVILASDHGYHLYEHGGLLHKMTVFEESARVPLVVVAPGAKAGTASPALVELVDLYPTLADACGLPAPPHVEGTSFAPLLVEPDRLWKKAAFTVVSHADSPAGNKHLYPDRLGRSIRTARWRYTVWHDGSRELYDHDADPREYRNLAANADHAATVTELEAQLAAGWQAAAPQAASADAQPISLVLFGDGVKHYRDETKRSEYSTYTPDQVTEIAENLLRYQRTGGGWPKNFDPARILTSAERDVIAAARDKLDTTLDNRATYPCVEYLAQAFNQTGDARYRQAAERGLAFLLAAQYENGGWPHTYPNTKGYYGHITLLDDVMVGTLGTIRRAARGDAPFTFLDDDLRERCADAHRRGEACLLRLQYRDGDRLTVWCGQYDERTLEPAWGRKFEPPSQVSAESVAALRYLMEIENPSEQVIESIRAGVAWLRDVQIAGHRVKRHDDGDRTLVADPAAPPLWSRFYEFGTHRPLMCNRDSQVVYRLDEVEPERRRGYAWYTTAPTVLLAHDYPRWEQSMSAFLGATGILPVPSALRPPTRPPRP